MISKHNNTVTFYTPIWGQTSIWSLNQWPLSDPRLVCPWFQNSKWHWTTTTFRILTVLSPCFMFLGGQKRNIYISSFSCLNRALRVSPSISCFGLRSISMDECVSRGPEFRPLFCWTSHLLCPVLRQWLGPTFIGAYIAIWLSFIGAQVRCTPNDGWISKFGGQKTRLE